MASGTIAQGMNNSGAGYCKMPDGTLIQWGRHASEVSVAASGGRAEDTITFPITFVDANYIPSVSDTTSVCTQRRTAIRTRSAGSLGLYYENTNPGAWTPTVYWQAIGRWK